MVKSYGYEIFVEPNEAQLTCEYTVKVGDEEIKINEREVIERFEWFKDGKPVEVSHFQISQNNLIFNQLDQNIHNGSYSCKIKLKNGQTIESSNTYPVIVYKCMNSNY